MATTWTDLSTFKYAKRNDKYEKEVELVECDVISYGLYEDLYKYNTLSVEQVYTEIWD